MKIFIYSLLFILFFIKITCIKDNNADNSNNYEPINSNNYESIEMYSIDGVPYYVADIGALIISNKSSENINVRFLKLGITNIDIITNGYYLRYFDGISPPNFFANDIYNNPKEFFFNNKRIFNTPLGYLNYRFTNIVTKEINLYFYSNRINFKITNINILVENIQFITNSNFKKMKKYLVNANLKETFYPGRFMFVVLTIDDNILTNTYWGTTNE